MAMQTLGTRVRLTPALNTISQTGIVVGYGMEMNDPRTPVTMMLIQLDKGEYLVSGACYIRLIVAHPDGVEKI